MMLCSIAAREFNAFGGAAGSTILPVGGMPGGRQLQLTRKRVAQMTIDSAKKLFFFIIHHGSKLSKLADSQGFRANFAGNTEFFKCLFK